MTDPGLVNQTDGAQRSPVVLSDDGRHYVCALDQAVIPDGAHVQADYDPANLLVGVRADTDPVGPGDTVTHSCGTLATVPGG